MMMENKDSNLEFMKLAIKEAKKSKQEKGKTPLYVGVVVVKDGKVLAQAHRGEFSQGEHAEYTVLERKLIDTDLSGATIYTTLEPCTTRNHPKVPCAERIVQRRLGRVVIGILDPNPDICGKGYWLLKKAEIEVELSPHSLQEEIRELNQEFIKEQLEIAKQGGKLQPDGSLKPEVLKERPEMQQNINISGGQEITIIQAWGNGYCSPSILKKKSTNKKSEHKVEIKQVFKNICSEGRAIGLEVDNVKKGEISIEQHAEEVKGEIIGAQIKKI